MRKKAVKLIISFAGISLIALAVVPQIRKHQKRTAALKCINNLRCIDGGKAQWALECRQPSNAIPTWDELAPFIVNAFYQDSNWTLTNYSGPRCPGNGTYTIRSVADTPTCSIPNHDPALLGGYVSVKDERGNDIEGANVVVIDESGQRRSGLTERNGWVEIVTWPKKAVAFIVSKDGFVTTSNSFPLSADVILKRDSK